MPTDQDHELPPAPGAPTSPASPSAGSPTPPPTGPAAATPPGEVIVELERWFDELAPERTHPVVVSTTLKKAGWSDAAATWAETRYRSRWSSHPAVWWGGFTAIGMAVLSWAGVVHSVIDGHSETAAAWFSVALVSTVFAVIAAVLISRILDWTQAFSSARRGAANTLFWAAIGASVFRGLVYGQVLGEALFVDEPCPASTTFGVGAYDSFDTYDSYGRVITDLALVDPARSAGRSDRFSADDDCDAGAERALAHLALTSVAAAPVAAWAWYGHRRPTDPPERDAAGVTGAS